MILSAVKIIWVPQEDTPMVEISGQRKFLKSLLVIMRILVSSQVVLGIMSVLLSLNSWTISVIVAIALILWIVLVIYLIATLVVAKGGHTNG